MRTASLFCSIPAASPGGVEPKPQPTFVASAPDPLAERKQVFVYLSPRCESNTDYEIRNLAPGSAGTRRGERSLRVGLRTRRFRRPPPGSARTSAQARRPLSRTLHLESRLGVAPSFVDLQTTSFAGRSAHIERPEGNAPSITEWHSALGTLPTRPR